MLSAPAAVPPSYSPLKVGEEHWQPALRRFDRLLGKSLPPLGGRLEGGTAAAVLPNARRRLIQCATSTSLRDRAHRNNGSCARISADRPRPRTHTSRPSRLPRP